MSTDVGGGVSVGFFMSYADALRPFTFTKDEVSHKEDRFDQKTGAKAGTETVVDVEGGTYVKLPGVEGEWGPVFLGDAEGEEMGSPPQDGTEEFLEALGGILGCQVEYFGGPSYSWVGFNVAVKSDYADEGYDCNSHISAGASLYFSRVVEMAGAVDRLSKEMKGVGFKKLGRPLVFETLSVSW